MGSKMTRGEFKDRVIAAAREALAVYCDNGSRVPVFKTDSLLPNPYWSPAGKIIDAAPMMKIHAALAELDAAPEDEAAE